MKQEALKLGISIEDTSIVNLINQINTIKINDEADKLGISTNGKEIEDIAEEIYGTKVREEGEVRYFTKRKRDRSVSARSVRTKSTGRSKKNIISICMGKIYIKY